jgi:hypothetical protein
MYRNPTTFATDPSQFYETEERDTEAIANYLQTHHPELKQVFEPYYATQLLPRYWKQMDFKSRYKEISIHFQTTTIS